MAVIMSTSLTSTRTFGKYSYENNQIRSHKLLPRPKNHRSHCNKKTSVTVSGSLRFTMSLSFAFIANVIARNPVVTRYDQKAQLISTSQTVGQFSIFD